ncbi:carboxyl-terminal protease [Syntrophobotulus glycolicus DSM 8271]|uniref:Carboxyl-terminal protease n=1 Tax=Syntrophobotulus glycolicus (strain DSM 8271 / FlGlyR) TaxID=645991 RepID=F0SWM7_SYNGF|nr:S41 family peptidase [Syntrophobotulus glycolicus]ADY56867.1 carboxyl-terminal protease [Syntrophobotulus glycolicus DSM 8271]
MKIQKMKIINGKILNKPYLLASLTALIFMFGFLFGSPLRAYAGDSVLEEVKTILQYNFVDEVKPEVLDASSVEEAVNRLGDPNTQYLTAQEYNNLISTLDRSVTGIGIELEVVPQGILVTRVYAGYPADQAGIKEGDIMTEADGQSLAGQTSELIVSKIRGAEGTTVKVKLLRDGSPLELSIQRTVINLPQVEGVMLDKAIGYIGLYSFGDSASEQFGEAVKNLKGEGADCWIIDLRYNGGGYTKEAEEILGYFIKNQAAYYTKFRNQDYEEYLPVRQEFTLNDPVIILTNQYTASASEILTGALKDYGSALVMGENTYGSGRVKGLFTLSNGDIFKTSLSRFYSPLKTAIDVVGIKPQIDLTGTDELAAAVLMLNQRGLAQSSPNTGTGADRNGYLQVKAAGGDYVLSLAEMREEVFWQAANKILDALPASSLKIGSKNGWEAFPDSLLKDRQKVFYPGYLNNGKLDGVELNKTFTITFPEDLDRASVALDKVELIEVKTGERMPLELIFDGSSDQFKVLSTKLLSPQTEYWLVIHPGIKDTAGREHNGILATVLTAEK